MNGTVKPVCMHWQPEEPQEVPNLIIKYYLNVIIYFSLISNGNKYNG